MWNRLEALTKKLFSGSFISNVDILNLFTFIVSNKGIAGKFAKLTGGQRKWGVWEEEK